MPLYRSFLDRIESEHLFAIDESLLLAVSGGVDSVVLCHLLHVAGYRFEIAHCNFQLRGEDSMQDEAFVQLLGSQYGRKVWVKRFDTEIYAAQQGVSIQEAARMLRYRWFEELTEKEEPTLKWILTAHHADDNVETIAMHFFRGTGIAGLRGMVSKKGRLVRPLLSFSKEELVRYAHDHALNWREDRSNITEKYTRNYFRLQVLPMIEKAYPGALSNILDNAGRFAEVEQVYQQAIEQYRLKLLKRKGPEYHISIGQLRQVAPLRTILYELMKPFGFSSSQLPDLIGLLEGATGKYVASSSHRVIHNRHWLVVAPAAARDATHCVIESLPCQVQTIDGTMDLLDMQASDCIGLDEKEVQYLNADEIVFPLLLRRWRTGDYFYPLGMRKKKKVARFLIDQKIGVTEKEKIWLLLSGERVISIVGIRLDDRFKVTPNTQRLLKIHYKPLEAR